MIDGRASAGTGRQTRALSKNVRGLTLTSLLLLLRVPVFAQANPAALLAHDSHEGFVVACDPYLNADRARELMGKKNPLHTGILPIEVSLENNNDRPVQVNLDSIRLELVVPGQPRQSLEPLSLDDVVARTLHEHPNPNLASPRRRLPHPFPSAGRSKKWRELEDRLGRLSLQTGMVPPGATVHGLLFFDLAGHFELVRDARLYVPELQFVGANKPLMFFQVDLGGQH
jgi:hypothetical protein